MVVYPETFGCTRPSVIQPKLVVIQLFLRTFQFSRTAVVDETDRRSFAADLIEEEDSGGADNGRQRRLPFGPDLSQ